MDTQIKALLGGVGIELSSAWDPPGPSDGVANMRIILLNCEPSRFGAPADAMGMVPLGQTRAPVVYVFYRNVLRALHDSPTDPRHHTDAEIGAAIGRVAVHEVVHAVAPDTGHAVGGIMQRTLGHVALTQPRLVLDSHSAQGLVQALAVGRR